MAKQRYINTKFWSDNWISDLDPVEKLLFLYLLTNEKTNIAGIYELPLKIMSVETGIEKEMIEKIFKRFEKDGKVIFRNGWVKIVNFIKHQDTTNEKIKKGIDIVLSNIPKEVIDSLSIAHAYPSNNSNTNNNTNNIAIPPAVADKINPLIELFKEVNPSYERLFGNKTERSALARLTKKFGEGKVKEMISGLKQIFGKPYAPTITTPYQLEKKLADYISYIQKQKSNQSYIKIK